MSAITSESIKVSAGLPPGADSARPLLAWVGYVVAVFGCGVLFQYWQAEPVPGEVYLLAMTVLALCLLPVTIWQAGARHGAPMFELLCVAFGMAYAVPVFLHENAIRNFNTYSLLDWGVMQRALEISFLGIAAMIGGYYLFPRSPLAGWLPRADLPMEPKRLPKFLFLAFIVGGGLRLVDRVTVGGWGAGVTGALSSLITFVLGAGIALLAFRTFQAGAEASRGSKPLLYGVVGGAVVIGMGAGMLEEGFIPPIVLLVARWSARRRVPVLWLVLGGAAFVVLNSAKHDYRREIWYTEKTPSIPEQLAVWADKSALVVTTTEGLNDAVVRAVSRLDLIHIFAHVVELTPSNLPYYNGASYSYLIYGWIPRVIWPDKPISTEANIMFALDYGLLIESQRDSVRMGIGFLTEAYANFGTRGVLGVMFVIGCLFGAVATVFNGPQSDGGKAAYIAVLVFFLNGIGSATTMFFFFAVQGFVTLPLILRYFARSWRAPAGLPPADRS